MLIKVQNSRTAWLDSVLLNIWLIKPSSLLYQFPVAL